MERYHSAYEAIEIKSSFMYFVILCFNTFIAMSLLASASINPRDIVPSLVIMLTAIVLAYRIFKKKKAHKTTNILPWIVGFITVTAPIFQKYKYGLSLGDWTFALELYNSSIMLVVCIIIDQMFKNIEIAKNIGIGTEEQKRAIEGSSKAIEHVNFIVGEMDAEIEELAATSNKILNYSTELLKKAQEA